MEASGIGIACITAQYFKVPVVFAKKAQSLNLDGSLYTTKVQSYTHTRVYDEKKKKKFLTSDDHVLVIDDFLANGCAVNGLLDIIDEAGATLEGVGIVIEKGFQDGGKELRARGVDLKSLAIIKSMSDNSIEFEEQEV